MLQRSILIALAICLLSSSVVSQEGLRVVRPPSTAKPTSQKPTHNEVDLRKYGLDLLERAEADAGALDGGMRAWGLWQIARGYQQLNRSKALGLLDNALASVRELEEDRLNSRALLQKEIVASMVPLAPELADELVVALDPEARPDVLSALLRYYLDSKRTDRALEVTYRIAAESEMPYETAAQLMGTMTGSKSGEFLRLFQTSLNSYRDHASDQRRLQMGTGFPEMIARFWRQLPRELVRQSIDEVLKQTDPANAKDAPAVTFSMASDKGTLSFASAYQYQLFQFLPILQEIDSSLAEQYMKKYSELAALLRRHPQGIEALYSPHSEAPDAGTKLGTGVTYSVTRSAQPDSPYMADMQLVQKLTAEAESDHAREAVAKVPTIMNASLRGAAYHNIARGTMKRHPSIARECISSMLEIGEQLPAMLKLMSLRAAIDMYVQMNDVDTAKSLIERAMHLANDAYLDDAHPDDPNKALKAYWPATDAYRALLTQAAKISPPWAISLLNEISDPEMKVASEIAVAQTWLKVPRGQSVTMIDKKSNHGTMIGGPEVE
ncbi:MAG TPA: hypothetical protein VD837_12795 [Terriglobales bacterium]|nr:hypothetical protein [Terriglobales bacterium]